MTNCRLDERVLKLKNVHFFSGLLSYRTILPRLYFEFMRRLLNTKTSTPLPSSFTNRLAQISTRCNCAEHIQVLIKTNFHYSIAGAISAKTSALRDGSFFASKISAVGYAPCTSNTNEKVTSGMLCLPKSMFSYPFTSLLARYIELGMFRVAGLNRLRAKQLSAAEVKRGLRRNVTGGGLNITPTMSFYSPKVQSFLFSDSAPLHLHHYCMV